METAGTDIALREKASSRSSKKIPHAITDELLHEKLSKLDEKLKAFEKSLRAKRTRTKKLRN